MLHELAHVAHHVLVTALQYADEPSPAPASTDSGSGSFAGLAALIASITGLISAIGAIIIGLRARRDNSNGGNTPAADKAIEYLIKQNRELLKKQAKDDESK